MQARTQNERPSRPMNAFRVRPGDLIRLTLPTYARVRNRGPRQRVYTYRSILVVSFVPNRSRFWGLYESRLLLFPSHDPIYVVVARAIAPGTSQSSGST